MHYITIKISGGMFDFYKYHHFYFNKTFSTLLLLQLAHTSLSYEWLFLRHILRVVKRIPNYFPQSNNTEPTYTENKGRKKNRDPV
jgi:hypothetical protein